MIPQKIIEQYGLIKIPSDNEAYQLPNNKYYISIEKTFSSERYSLFIKNDTHSFLSSFNIEMMENKETFESYLENFIIKEFEKTIAA